ncbi:hypothetical protein [Enterococcus faecalis]|uniref:hypothetical protein n=1 Tax=Enterococcus faecalis TaxID=1351 RepID=UPI000DFC2EFD|nr:hypothetical protein [Enterococcus faecalis]EIT2042661.1 hypothetical protein [Enterococcus faecalis]STQ32690.1 Uncharacterised protein [Enterococcus faecalis]HAP4193184.1 hypothetical protein [Enterococcus faecalis]HAP5232087.1 hypothetical protein [Enterococcus faecalis]HAP5279482.1 hypothetical protein [Enterococcus faecalis]
MNKKLLGLISVTILTLLFLGGCGKKNLNEVLTDGSGKWELQSLDDSTHSAKIAFFSTGKANFLAGNNEIELDYKVNDKNTKIELVRPNSTDSMVKLTNIKIIGDDTIEAASQQGTSGDKEKVKLTKISN